MSEEVCEVSIESLQEGRSLREELLTTVREDGRTKVNYAPPVQLPEGIHNCQALFRMKAIVSIPVIS